MKKSFFWLMVVLPSFLLFFSISGKKQDVSSVKGQAPVIKKQNFQEKHGLKPDVNFGKLPLYFIANTGQVNAKAKFYARASRYTLWLTKEGLVFDSTHPAPSRHLPASLKEGISDSDSPASVFSVRMTKKNRDVSRLLFVGANRNPEIKAEEKAELKVNFFKGNNKSKWRAAPTSMAVRYKSLYKSIDLKIYGIEKQIEYDWIVKPGGSPEDIRFRYKDVKSTRIDKEGSLLIETAFGELKHKKPFAYQVMKESGKEAVGIRQEGKETGRQEPESTRQKVDVRFKKVDKNTYGFAVGEYDKRFELVIDPVVLAYSTYLGGNDIDLGLGIAVDDSSYAYVTGGTGSSNFPILNQYQGYQASFDVYVTKIDPNLSGAPSLLYSTYIGGNDIDCGYSIAVDDIGNVYVTGFTDSSDFPTLNQYQGYTDNRDIFVTRPSIPKWWRDAFVAKLDTTRSGAASLLYSTYLGGNNEDRGWGIAVDGSGYAYVTGKTWSSDFPTLNQYMGDQDSQDSFVTKLDTTQSGAASLLYSTYLGGNNWEQTYGIAVDSSGYAYVIGETRSSDFPTLNQYQGYQGDWDVFVTKLDPAQSGAPSLLYSTYLGGNDEDSGMGIAVDGSGYVYVTGYTSSSDFPTLNQYMGAQDWRDSFVTKLDTTQSGTVSLLYSTYLGGNSWDSGYGIAVDGSGCAYVTGNTDSSDFPTLNQYQGNQPDHDAFVTKLDTTQSGTVSLLYSTYLGGDDRDEVYGIAVDSSGYAYVIGETRSSDFPTLNQYQGNQPDYDAFVTKLCFSQLIITAPNGGETWTVGSVQDITWTSVGLVGDVKIENSTDNGGTWSNIIASTANDGSHPWTIPYTPSSQCLVRVSKIDGDPTDTSDAPFTIHGLGLTSPNGGEQWDSGKIKDITWLAAGSFTGLLKITLWQNGVRIGTIAKDIDPTAGSYPWPVGDYIRGSVTGTGYSIKIKEIGTTLSDTSDAPFIINKFIGVTSPDGGENWAIGDIQNITWRAKPSFGPVKITLWKDGVFVGLIAKDVDSASGYYPWTVGNYSGGTAAAGSGYTIKVRVIGTTKVDTSDAAFTLSD